MNEEFDAVASLTEQLIAFGTTYAFQIVGAVVVIILGVVAGRVASRGLLKMFEKRGVDITLARLSASSLRMVIIGFALVVALGKFGITLSPLIAAIGGMMFGASFAIQGPLANFGAGVVIILTRPFVIGDTVTVAGASGLVEEIKLGATLLRDEDGVRIIVPNKHIVGEVVRNSATYRCAEGQIGIDYSDDPAAAIAAIRQVLAGQDNVRKDPAPQVGVEKFDDSAIVIGFRYWATSRIYYDTVYSANQAVFEAVKTSGVNIPFPRLEVQMLEKSA